MDGGHAKNGFVSYYASIITESKKHLFFFFVIAWRKVKTIPTIPNEIKGLNSIIFLEQRKNFN